MHPKSTDVTRGSPVGPRLGLLLATPGLALLLGCAHAPEGGEAGSARADAGALCLTGACGEASGLPQAGDMVFDSDGRLFLSQDGSAIPAE